MNRTLARVGAIIVVAWLLSVAAAQAQQNEVIIEGNNRIEDASIISYMQLDQSKPFGPAEVDQALKNLFATGLFADVTIRRENGAFVVRVVENPIINRIAFEGNRRIDDETLRPEVQLRPRVVYTRTKVQSDVQRLLEVYRRSGRFAATIEPKIIQLEQNRVDLVFEVNEGEVTGVRDISFIGNEVFSDGDLREEVLTSESAWYRFLNQTDTYDPDRIAFDRELLRKFYLSEGYADFRVESTIAELTPDREDFFITFTVSEGERYRFGEVDLETNFEELDVEELRGLVTTVEGEWYNADQVEETITLLTDALGVRGFAFVDIRPRVDRDRDEKTIGVTYEINEGPRVYVERINVNGNTRTQDRVVRREFTLAEGDAFNSAKLRRSQQNIRNLGFFERVDVTTKQGSAPDKTVIDVDVVEQSTGELSFGVGYATTGGLLGDVSIRERNLLGRGQDLRLGFSLGTRNTQIDLSFTEPYFLGKPLAAGFDVFRVTRDRQSESSYDQKSLGFALRAGYDLQQDLRQTWRYSLRQEEVTDIESTASLAIRELEGKAITSEIGQVLSYDKRDSRFETREGYVLRWSTDLAGLGGDVHYLRNRLQAAYYHTIWDDVTLSASGEVGYLVGLGEETRITDRFFLGGENLRGFATAGAGPRDRDTDDSVGGNVLYNGSLEAVFPIGLPREYGVRGKVFTDFGSLFDVGGDIPGTDIVDEHKMRVSIGTGFNWRSPFGPISVDVAYPLVKEEYDEPEAFRFSFGTRF